MSDDWGLLDKWAEQRRTQVREIHIGEPRYSGEHHPRFGLSIQLSERTAQVISVNIHEIRAWGEALIAFAEEHENK